MNDLLIYLFSVMLVGYIVSKVFSNVGNSNNEYKSNIGLSVIGITIVWCFIVISFIFNTYILKIISLFMFLLIISKEIITSFLKLKRFAKDFKIILTKEDYNISNKIKKQRIKESLNNIFIVLGAPLIIVEHLVNKLLNYIFE